MNGVVAEFDFDRGLGVVVDDLGQRFPFHCVSIADNSRSIAVGTRVHFERLPKLGVHEAANISVA